MLWCIHAVVLWVVHSKDPMPALMLIVDGFDIHTFLSQKHCIVCWSYHGFILQWVFASPFGATIHKQTNTYFVTFSPVAEYTPFIFRLAYRKCNKQRCMNSIQ